jgi:hypothetical protein
MTLAASVILIHLVILTRFVSSIFGKVSWSFLLVSISGFLLIYGICGYYILFEFSDALYFLSLILVFIYLILLAFIFYTCFVPSVSVYELFSGMLLLAYLLILQKPFLHPLFILISMLFGFYSLIRLRSGKRFDLLFTYFYIMFLYLT